VGIESEPIVKMLLARGADVNATNRDGFTPLHLATHVGVAKVLLEHKADVNAKAIPVDGKGKPLNLEGEAATEYTPLHLAILRDEQPMVKLLLAHKDAVNVKDWTGKTPLHLAVTAGDKEAVELLLRHKADVSIRDGRGRSPLTVAIESGQKDIADLLRRKVAEVDK
jgi:ankyrin repeat protein